MAPSRLFRFAVIAVAIVSSTEGVAAANCKSYANCREAVIAWCAGKHPGADRDKDGIPCEHVCRSLAEVVAIMSEIGCPR